VYGLQQAADLLRIDGRVLLIDEDEVVARSCGQAERRREREGKKRGKKRREREGG